MSIWLVVYRSSYGGRTTARFADADVADRATIAQPGTTTHELIFICAGLLRFYYVADDGAETNKAFIAENDFASPLAAAMLNLPIYYGIQALEPTTLFVARYDDFAALLNNIPSLTGWGAKWQNGRFPTN